MPTGNYELKGKKLPSVTTIINRFKNATGLIIWSNQLGLKGTNIGTIKNDSVRGILNNSIETAKVAVRDVSVDDEGNSLSKDQVEKNINALAKAYGVNKHEIENAISSNRKLNLLAIDLPIIKLDKKIYLLKKN